MEVSNSISRRHEIRSLSARPSGDLRSAGLDNGGSDDGMSPPEFLLASLGTCAGLLCGPISEHAPPASADLQVRVTAEKGTQPARLASFKIDVTAPGLDDHHQAGVLAGGEGLPDSQHSVERARHRCFGRRSRPRTGLSGYNRSLERDKQKLNSREV